MLAQKQFRENDDMHLIEPDKLQLNRVSQVSLFLSFFLNPSTESDALRLKSQISTVHVAAGRTSF